MFSRRLFLKTLVTSGAGFLGLGGYAGAIEPLVRLDVTRYDLALPKWPAGAKPLRMALVADIHACEPWMPVRRIGEIVAVTNSLGADIVLLLGDYVRSIRRFGTRDVPPEAWGAALAKLRAPLGVYAILGNHDYRRDGPEPVRRALAGAGIEVLENHAIRIARDGHAFWLSGTGSMVPFVNSEVRYDDLPTALAQVTDDLPVIHMAHEPDLFVDIPDRIALTLSGHTHGGQVVLPFVGPIETASDYGSRFAYGHIVEGDRHLLVSGGLGCSHIPVRFGSPPEIVLATARSSTIA